MFRRFVVFSLFLLLLSPALYAMGRPVTKRASPSYPEIARRMHITGSVRVQVKVSPEGKVTDASVLSGNPMLKDAALHAAHNYVYEPTAEETTEIITFTFNME